MPTCKMTLLLLRLLLMKLAITSTWVMILKMLEHPMIRISELVQRTDLPALTLMVSWTTMKQVLYHGLVAQGKIHVIWVVIFHISYPQSRYDYTELFNLYNDANQWCLEQVTTATTAAPPGPSPPGPSPPGPTPPGPTPPGPTPPGPTPPGPAPCEDRAPTKRCKRWKWRPKKAKRCNKKFFRKRCRKTCKVCTPWLWV